VVVIMADRLVCSGCRGHIITMNMHLTADRFPTLDPAVMTALLMVIAFLAVAAALLAIVL